MVAFGPFLFLDQSILKVQLLRKSQWDLDIKTGSSREVAESRIFDSDVHKRLSVLYISNVKIKTWYFNEKTKL